MNELKPCPFCGLPIESDNPYMEVVSYGFAVTCTRDECWAQGPVAKCEHDAASAWNRRKEATE